MIPPLTREGLLPPGIHWTTWDAFATRFGGTPERERMLVGLQAALENLTQAGCQAIYIDGSFVTRKVVPNDYDACYNLRGVNFDLVDPVLKDFSEQRRAMKEKYGGELFTAEAPADFAGRVFIDYFQRDRKTGKRKGIIGIKLQFAGE